MLALAIGLSVLLVTLSPVKGLITSDSHVARAAILDQLDLSYPNPEFVRAATSTLEDSGYEVDYYRGPEVTVELYRRLPQLDYDVVIFRVHSGLVAEVDESSGSETLTDYVSLFTGEPYSESKYTREVREGPLGIASQFEGGPQYFGVGPSFVESEMKGRFDDTLVILMGCDGLRSSKTAEAFLSRGARGFVSWDKPVTAEHTDAATERLLQHLFIDKLDLKKAVEQTSDEVGTDPTFGSRLLVYP